MPGVHKPADPEQQCRTGTVPILYCTVGCDNQMESGPGASNGTPYVRTENGWYVRTHPGKHVPLEDAGNEWKAENTLNDA